MTSSFWLRLGTRASPLALAQAFEVRSILCRTYGRSVEEVEIVSHKTEADRIQDRPLFEINAKGLFTKELDEALLDGRIDVAVHSAKDIGSIIPLGLSLEGFLEREDPRDAFVSINLSRLQDLPKGAVIGSASLRRGAFVQQLRPDVKMQLLRGNVTTRLDKLKRGQVDALVLAVAGLKRLKLLEYISEIFDATSMLPAVGQGAIALMLRQRDEATRAIVAPVLHEETGVCVMTERRFLEILDGSCRVPIGGYATLMGDHLTFSGAILPAGARYLQKIIMKGPKENALKLGQEAAQEILSRMKKKPF